MYLQLFQHHLLMRLSLFHCIVFSPLSNITRLYICGSISGLFHSIDVICLLFKQYHTALITVGFVLQISLDVGQCQSSNLVLLLQYCVGYSGSFASLHKLSNQLVEWLFNFKYHWMYSFLKTRSFLWKTTEQ